MAELKLRDDQMTDLAYLIKQGRGGLWHDPGVGKTPPSCLFMYYLWVKQGARSVWAMPTHLMDKNRKELLAWSNFKESDVVIVDGTRSRKDAAISSGAKVFITSFPGLVARRDGVAEWTRYKDLYPDFNAVVLDEPHKYFSNDGSPSTQELYRCMKQVKYFLPMTGTVIKGRLDSAYPLVKIINPNYYGNYRDFLAQHAILDYWGKIIGWRNHEKLEAVLKATGRRTSFQEIYGDRDIVYFIQEVDMEPKQLEVYNEFKQMGAVELERVMMEGSNEGVNLLRLRQILAHPERIKIPTERDEDGKPTKYSTECVSLTNGRDVFIKEHLEEHLRTGESLLIVSTLIPEQERLYKLATDTGLKAALINSNVPNNKRFEIDKDFRSGKIQVIIGSPSTCGTGFNWPHLNHILFAALDFAADDFIQVMMRAFRGVRTQPLKATLIQYKKSVDQDVDRVLDKKSRESALIDPTYLVLNLSPERRTSSGNVYTT